MRIICGLGNPGEKYRHTRHNLGFDVVDRLAGPRGKWSSREPESAVCHTRVGGEDAILVKPLTYMNLSGDALSPLVTDRGVPLGRVLVVCDDIALPLGALRLRGKGSDGGHNGLASLIESLGSPAFPRLRIGVGPVPEGVDPADFVLDRFREGEERAVAAVLRQATRCVGVWASDGLATAMNRFNTRPAPESD